MELARFSEDFRKLDATNEKSHLSLKVGHNYRGQEPIVIVVDPNPKTDLQQDLYAKEATYTIVNVLRESRGLKSVLVAPFVYSVTLTLS